MEIRFPIGPRFFTKFRKAYTEWNNKIGIGSFAKDGSAFLYAAPSKYSKRRIILVKKKITGRCEVEN
jgi:hypothetical protein